MVYDALQGRSEGVCTIIIYNAFFFTVFVSTPMGGLTMGQKVGMNIEIRIPYEPLRFQEMSSTPDQLGSKGGDPRSAKKEKARK